MRLLVRAHKVADPDHLHEELEGLKTMFYQNGYATADI